MFDFNGFPLEAHQLIILASCAVVIGASKTCLPGMSILAVPVFASILSPKISVGVVLPMLIFADIFAITYYHKHAQWRNVLRIIPPTLVGLGIGYYFMDKVDNRQLQLIIGVIVLAMLAMWSWQNFRTKSKIEEDGKVHPAYVLFLGLAVGISTMMANAAGPIVMIYLLSLGLGKKKFLGTGAWFIFIINWIKLPLNVSLGLITLQSLKLDLLLFPMVLIGALTGIFALKWIPQKVFTTTIIILALASAVKLILTSI